MLGFIGLGVMGEPMCRNLARKSGEAVLAGELELEDLDTAGYTVYSHQNEDIVRLTPDELKRKMAAKEAASR